jgi:hypothetical protein
MRRTLCPEAFSPARSRAGVRVAEIGHNFGCGFRRRFRDDFSSVFPDAQTRNGKLCAVEVFRPLEAKPVHETLAAEFDLETKGLAWRNDFIEHRTDWSIDGAEEELEVWTAVNLNTYSAYCTILCGRLEKLRHFTFD